MYVLLPEKREGGMTTANITLRTDSTCVSRHPSERKSGRAEGRNPNHETTKDGRGLVSKLKHHLQKKGGTRTGEVEGSMSIH